MLLTSLIRKHLYSYISENNFEPSNHIIVPTGYNPLTLTFPSLTVICITRWVRRQRPAHFKQNFITFAFHLAQEGRAQSPHIFTHLAVDAVRIPTAIYNYRQREVGLRTSRWQWLGNCRNCHSIRRNWSVTKTMTTMEPTTSGQADGLISYVTRITLYC